MTSILDLEPRPSAKPEAVDVASPNSDPEPATATGDYEIVLGRAQIASWLFVGVIALAVGSSLAYLGGETIAAKKNARPVAVTIPTPAPTAQAAISVPTNRDSILNASTRPAQPLFAEPEMGKVYLQIGGLERGMAGILADGLRSHGLNSFVAPGPNDRIFRVLIGPLPDPQAFREAMIAVANLDLATFVRKYEK